jgi:MscS family membrane protein
MTPQFLTDWLGEDAADLVTKLLTIFLILLFTWILRRIVISLLPRFIHLITSRIRPDLGKQIIQIVQPPLQFLINILGLWLVLTVIELPADADNIVNHIMSSLIAIAIFWALYRGVDLLLALIKRLTQSTETARAILNSSQLSTALGQLVKAVIVVFTFVTVMEEWGYSVGGLLAGLGIGGLAVALAAQDALANLFGYFVILADEPFSIGEFVKIGELGGTVEGLSFRSTRIRASDQSLVIVPNSTIVNANLVNWSRLTKRRLEMKLGLSHETSPRQVLAVVQMIRDMLQKHELVQSDSVVVQFVEFADNALSVIIICFMKTPAWNDFQAAKQDINLKIMQILEHFGVTLALPTTTIVLDSGIASAAPPRIPPLKPEPAQGPSDSPVPDDAAN